MSGGTGHGEAVCTGGDGPGAWPEALSAAEGRFRRIIEQTVDGIVVVGHDGAVRFANPAAAELFGHTQDELEGQLFGFPMSAGEDD